MTSKHTPTLQKGGWEGKTQKNQSGVNFEFHNVTVSITYPGKFHV